MTRVAAAVIALLLLPSAPQAATIVYQTLPPDQRFIYFADTDDIFTTAAMVFSLDAGESVTGANWWGGCFVESTTDAGTSGAAGGSTCPAGDFTVTFFADSAGTPGAVIATINVGPANQAATGNDIGAGIAEYSYSAQFGAVPLVAGPTYWFGISAVVAGTTWGWETAGGEGTHAQLSTAAVPADQIVPGWNVINNNLAFQLTGPDTAAVPEPATLSLVAIGLGGAMLRRHKRRK